MFHSVTAAHPLVITQASAAIVQQRSSLDLLCAVGRAVDVVYHDFNTSGMVSYNILIDNLKKYGLGKRTVTLI